MISARRNALVLEDREHRHHPAKRRESLRTTERLERNSFFSTRLPKMILWKVTAQAGICFLMETQGQGQGWFRCACLQLQAFTRAWGPLSSWQASRMWWSTPWAFLSSSKSMSSCAWSTLAKVGCHSYHDLAALAQLHGACVALCFLVPPARVSRLMPWSARGAEPRSSKRVLQGGDRA